MRIASFPVRGLCGGLLLASLAALADSPGTLRPGVSDTYLMPQGVQRFVLEIESPGRLRLEGQAWDAIAEDQVWLRARLVDAQGREVASAMHHHYGPFDLVVEVESGRYVLEVEGHNFSTRDQLEMSRYSIRTTLE